MDAVRNFFTHPQMAWIILWLGLAALSITLLVMMWTSWGQSNPLRKCAVLSMLVHVIFGVYATTVQICTAVTTGPPGTSIRATLVSGPANGTDDEDGSPSTERPWDRFATTAVPNPETTSLARPDVETPGAIPRRVVEDVPSLDVIPPRGVTNDAVSVQSATKTPEPIDQPAPTRSDPIDPLASVRAVPERATKPASDPATRRDPTKDGGMPLPDAGDANARLANADATGATASRLPAPVATGEPNGDPSAKPSGAGTNAARPGGGGADGSGGTGETESPNPYSLRFAPDRTTIARQHGGSPETESAVRSALGWLAANQNADGRWDPAKFGAGKELVVLGQDRKGAGAKADTGITGLALLALLAAGHTHLDGKYAKNVQFGLEFLLRSQGRDGNLGGDAEIFAFMYCHGMATLALSEAYGMTKDKRLEAPLRRAITYSLSAQHPSTGGWRYQPQDTGDTSQLGWQLMSLKSADNAGIPLPERTRDGMARFLQSVSAGNHGRLASYRPGERISRSMTAEALVCRQFLGLQPTESVIDEASNFIVQELPGGDKHNLYYWYYATLTLYQAQGPQWKEWNDALQTTLIKSQESNGSWNPADDLWGGYGGRVYSTAMATLCLEVYYRYLPLYVVHSEKDPRRK